MDAPAMCRTRTWYRQSVCLSTGADQDRGKSGSSQVRFFPPRIFRGSPFLDTGLNILRIFKKYILII
jgi:hypothetical protein